MPKCSTVSQVYFTPPLKYKFLFFNISYDLAFFFFLKYLGTDTQKCLKM